MTVVTIYGTHNELFRLADGVKIQALWFYFERNKIFTSVGYFPATYRLYREIVYIGSDIS